MRRCALGCWLLIGLLGLSLFAAWAVNHLLDPVSRDLETAGECALAGDWAGADALAAQAWENWQSQWTLTAALNSHTPMENADNWFARLEVFRQTRDPTAFAEACAQIAGLVSAIGEGQLPSLKNLL